MASLMDNLLEVLEEEDGKYRQLVELSQEKKDVLIRADIDRLNQITEREQDITTDLQQMEKKRREVLADMAIVLRRKEEDLTLDSMVDLLDSQPEEKERLVQLRDRLRKTLDEMNEINSRNQMLLQQAIDMVEFDLTLFRSMRQAPETANYDRHAENTGQLLGSSGFDARQ